MDNQSQIYAYKALCSQSVSTFLWEKVFGDKKTVDIIVWALRFLILQLPKYISLGHIDFV